MKVLIIYPQNRGAQERKCLVKIVSEILNLIAAAAAVGNFVYLIIFLFVFA